MSELIKMDPELKQQWTSSLRGGEYIQAIEVLFHEGLSATSGKLAMCCLGVLEHVCGTDTNNMLSEGMPDDVAGGKKFSCRDS